MTLPSLKKIFLPFLIFWAIAAMAQFTVPKKPAVLYPVYDEVGLLTETEKSVINQKLIKFADSTSTEISVVILPTTNGEDINHAAWQIGESWGIGQKNVDNGIVFLIATEDRKMSIQQGRAVEKYLTASVAGQIIDYIVAPNFKQGLWYEGINRGTTALMETVQGKFKPIVQKTGDDSGLSFFQILLLALFIMLILRFLFRNKGGRGNDDDDDVILTRRGRRTYPGGFFPFPMGGGGFGGGFGRGGGGFGGGGFGGFGGGGSFGGGGASGGW